MDGNVNQHSNSKKLKKRDELYEDKAFFEKNVKGKRCYFVYISSTNVKENTLLFQRDSSSNDPCEHVPDCYKNDFYRCLTYFRHESVAMWMVYAKKGCCMRFTPALIEDVAKYVETIELFKTKKPTGSPHKTLYKKDMDEDKNWFHSEYVFYRGDKIENESDNESFYYVKRSTHARLLSESCNDEIDKMCFTKSVCWDYECEVRLCLSYEKLCSKVGNELLEKTKCIRVTLKPTGASKIEMRLSPLLKDKPLSKFARSDLFGRVWFPDQN